MPSQMGVLRPSPSARIRLRWLLLALVLAVAVPTLAVGLVATWQAATGERDAAEARLRDTARALALAVDREINTYRSTLAGLAGAVTLDGPAPDLAAFEVTARRAQAVLDTSLILVDAASLRQLINTSLRPGERPGPAPAASFRAAVETRRPVVTDLVSAAVAGQPLVGVGVPVEREGEVRFVLAARLDPGRLHGMLAAQNLPPGSYATVVDGKGLLVARSDGRHAEVVGHPIRQESLHASAGRPDGFFRAPGIDGAERVFAFRMSEAAPGWRVSVSEPAASFDAAWRGPIVAVATGGALALALGTALALLLARRILLPLDRLRRHAAALAGGTPGATAAAIPPAMVAELETLRRGFAEAEAAIGLREARLRSVVDTAADGILVAGADGRIVSANPAALRIFGHRQEELTGAPLGVLMPEGEAGRHDGHLAAHRATGQARALGVAGRQLMGRRRDGTEFPVELSVGSFEAGGERFFTGVVRDVTRRVAAEAAVTRHAERQALLLDLSRAILEEARDEAGLAALVFERVGPALGADMLFNFALEEGGGALLRLVAAPGVPQAQLDALRGVRIGEGLCGAVFAGGEAVSVDAARIGGGAEGTVLRALGVTAYVGHPLLGTDGRPFGTLAFASTARDRFEAEDLGLLQTLSRFVALAWQRRRAEAALRESEAFGRSVLCSTSDCMAVLDGEARLVFMNEPGRCQNEIEDLGTVLGSPVVALWPEESRPAVQAAIGQARAGQAARYTAYGPTAKGTPKWWDVTVTSLPGPAGEAPRLLSVARDITEARHAEQEMQDQEAFLRSVLDASTDCMKVVERDGTLSFMNANGQCLMEIDDFEAIRGADWAALWPEAGQGQVRQAVAAALADRPARFEAFCPTAKGTPKWWDVAVAPVRDAEGRVARLVSASRDVTARKRAERALARSEGRFRAAVQAVRGILWTNNAAGEMVGEQPGWAALTGQSYAEYQGYGWAKAVHPDDVEPSVQAWQAAVAVRRTFDFEHRVRTRDGTWRRFSIRAIPVLDGGEIREWVGVHTDVTEQREAEARLAESERHLRLEAERMDLALAAGAIIGTWNWDLTTDRFTVDERFAQVSGLDPALGHSGLPLEQVIATVHPADVAGLREAIAQAIAQGGAYSHEYRVRGRDGAYRWIEANGRVDLAADGAPLRFPGVLLDIGRRRAVEERLRENEARLRQALEAGRMGIWEWDLDANLLTWDARQFELFGLDPAAGMPTGDAALACVHPGDRLALEAAILTAMESEDGAYDAEFRIVLPGGAVRWLGGHGHAVRGADGRARRMVGLNFDITERREAEEVLARSRGELERLVEERTAALRASEERLAEAARMEALGRLAGGIAHDFNNVLQAVQGGVTLAAKRIRRDPEGAQRFLDLALDSTERGAAVTGRLLAFARRSELSAAPVEPRPMLEGLAQMLRLTLGPSVALRVEVAPDAPAMLADAAQLEAVLVNLANNARDALPEGGGTVTLAAAPARAPASLPPGEYVRVTVTDDGYGMTPEVLARITEPFFTTKPKGKGTGLGLAMARGFAEQSGGGLTIASMHGRGTTIALWLPRAGDGAERAAEEAEEAPPAGPRRSLLVVDDEPGIRATLAAALAEQGHAVAEAEDAHAALARLDSGLLPDALVTDLSMPGGMDGLALAREARQRRPGLPVLLVTGHVGDAARGALEEAAAGGAFAVLRKPVSAGMVDAQIAALLEGAA